MEEKEHRGTVVGNQKIFCVKFADDVAIVADHEEGLRKMLVQLEIYCDKNDLEENTEKSKIIKFRNGGRREKKQGRFFKRRKLEEVEKKKYWATYLPQQIQKGST